LFVSVGDQLDSSLYHVDGYKAFFSFCQVKKGYSGNPGNSYHNNILFHVFVITYKQSLSMGIWLLDSFVWPLFCNVVE